jgi:5'-nucleotidase
VRILLSNDDGLRAPGIKAMAEALARLGEVWVVAPDRERSAVSHAISLHQPLRAEQIDARTIAVDGTPTDCVYLALNHFMPDPPDLVVSGINRGANLGNDVLYSGTVSAAMEGALFGFPALAISLCLPDRHLATAPPPDFSAAASLGVAFAEALTQSRLPPGSLLNVNVPALPRAEIAGVKLCRLGYTDWADEVTVRADPRGRPYFWIGGDRNGHDAIDDSDNEGIRAGYCTVTPIHYDLTDYRSFRATRALRLDGYAWAGDRLGDDPLPHPIHPRLGGGS